MTVGFVQELRYKKNNKEQDVVAGENNKFGVGTGKNKYMCIFNKQMV